MRKIIYIGLMSFLCFGCQLDNNQPKTMSEMWENETPDNQAVITTPKAAYAPKYASDAERYRQNIVVKATGENYVVYEYSDVRIDDVASLASAYCFENSNGLKAYLRDIYMYRNNKRRATFDCVNLASN